MTRNYLLLERSPNGIAKFLPSAFLKKPSPLVYAGRRFRYRRHSAGFPRARLLGDRFTCARPFPSSFGTHNFLAFQRFPLADVLSGERLLKSKNRRLMRLIRKRKRRNRTFSWSLLNVARISSLSLFLSPPFQSLTENITTTLPSFFLSFFFFLFTRAFSLYTRSPPVFVLSCRVKKKEDTSYSSCLVGGNPTADCRFTVFNGEQNENGTFDSKDCERGERREGRVEFNFNETSVKRWSVPLLWGGLACLLVRAERKLIETRTEAPRGPRRVCKRILRRISRFILYVQRDVTRIEGAE